MAFFVRFISGLATDTKQKATTLLQHEKETLFLLFENQKKK